jgi:adhesin/invasin
VLPALHAQKPVIATGGIVNAASFKPDPTLGTVLVVGGIYTIFGTNLASSVQTAAVYPLPTTLGGTTVTVGGIPAPLLYVSPGQINFQVPTNPGYPYQIDFSPNAVVATMANVARDPVPFTPAYEGAGIFTQDGSGCGPGAVQNVNPDGTVTSNSKTQSASPGGFITIWGTGLGHVDFPPPDGSPAVTDPLSAPPLA